MLPALKETTGLTAGKRLKGKRLVRYSFAAHLDYVHGSRFQVQCYWMCHKCKANFVLQVDKPSNQLFYCLDSKIINNNTVFKKIKTDQISKEMVQLSLHVTGRIESFSFFYGFTWWYFVFVLTPKFFSHPLLVVNCAFEVDRILYTTKALPGHWHDNNCLHFYKRCYLHTIFSWRGYKEELENIFKNESVVFIFSLVYNYHFINER